MKKRTIPALLASTALAMAPAIHAAAQSNQAANFAEALASDGFTIVEITSVDGQTKVEGIRDGIEREVTFDNATGTVVKDETGPADAEDATAPDIVASPEALSLAEQLANAGFAFIELDSEDDTITIEGLQGDQEREVVINASTGEVISDETTTVDPDDGDDDDDDGDDDADDDDDDDDDADESDDDDDANEGEDDDDADESDDDDDANEGDDNDDANEGDDDDDDDDNDDDDDTQGTSNG